MKRFTMAMLALSLMCSVFAGAKTSTKVVKGWVTDSICGAKGANADHADCAKKCVKEKGAKLAIVSDKDHKVLTVDNPEALAGHEGHHVSVRATKQADGSIHVADVDMLKDQGKAKSDSMSDMHK
jgi:hypothetical protein